MEEGEGDDDDDRKLIEIPLVYVCLYVPSVGMYGIGMVAMRIALNKYCGLCSWHDPACRTIR
jgi:hypothetical protein